MDNLTQRDSDIFSHHRAESLPNATSVLVLGIASILTCFCYGLPGIICGIIALILASKDNRAYKANPTRYTPGSHSNVVGGKVCAIIGLIFSALFFLVFVFLIAIFGWAVLTHPEMMQNNFGQ